MLVCLLLVLNSVLFLFICLHLFTHESVLEFKADDYSLWQNDRKLLNFRKGSSNLRLITYLFENADRDIAAEELEQNVFLNNSITISKVMRNTGIPSQVIKQHFEIKRESIKLRKKRTPLE
ncbi:hypothetical protein BS333_07900 [Vibrio azureus]|uniref:Uncharacterized protein n=1 Tax=Vibrio azureus NBRC 104587 TaxID=1219077 RepID=U3APR2_9VIBR|nr:hypothetical protein [Vibrio azureus]AUI86319.1 hypothetical protein BS333_07900 [Vibrio azureus]GAD75760.1 hypothetical protein VAZ01S_029_00300 [Vibrio azureus NBRC 104587]